MAITINNIIGGVEVVFDADNKKVFPKESARLDFKQNKVYLSDVAPERGEIVTLTASDVTSPSVANNSLLFDAIRDMVYESEELTNIRQKMEEIAVNTFSGTLDTLTYINDLLTNGSTTASYGDKTATPGEFYHGTLTIVEFNLGANGDYVKLYRSDDFAGTWHDNDNQTTGQKQFVYSMPNLTWTGFDYMNQGSDVFDEITYMVSFNGWKGTLL